MRHDSSQPAAPSRFAGVWLLTDLALNIWALSIVKALGLGYPAWQIVFLRALTGLLLISPWIVKNRASFRNLPDLPLHALRVVLSFATLTVSFFAIARLPFALFSAISFTRPLITMVMAALILRETIGTRRWWAAGIGLIGVWIAVEPSTLTFGWGLPAQLLTVLLASCAIIATRRLAHAPTLVLMAFYTGGLTLLTLPLTALTWQPVTPGHWPALLAIGVFAQSAQYCFLQAHKGGEAGYLSVLSYSSLILSTGAGYFFFDEIPTLAFALGAAIIIFAALWATRKSPPPTRLGNR